MKSSERKISQCILALKLFTMVFPQRITAQKVKVFKDTINPVYNKTYNRNYKKDTIKRIQ